jgi:putative hydrolase of HD superfamily
MNSIAEIYRLILEMNKLKTVFRNTITLPDRKESTAEHSWSASMIVFILLAELKTEFGQLDELKIFKLILLHDCVEIYAGDVFAFDIAARKDKEKVETEALAKLAAIYPTFGNEFSQLWHEFENKSSIEAQIAKAADAICPMFQRLHTSHAYSAKQVTISHLEASKYPHFAFSKIFTALYQQLKQDMLADNLVVF